MPTPAQYRHAIATCETLTGAARLLGVSIAAVSLWRRRRGMEPLPPGPRPQERVCAVHAEPQRDIPAAELAALHADLGTTQTAVALGVAPASVWQRMRRLLARVA